MISNVCLERGMCYVCFHNPFFVLGINVFMFK